MKHIFNTFPNVNNDNNFSRFGIVLGDLDFSYKCDNDEIIELEKEKINNNYICKDKQKGLWKIEKHGLIVSKKITINNIKEFFGNDGIVSKNSEIGIAINWMSKKSQCRETVKVFGIDKKEEYIFSEMLVDKNVFNCVFEIPKNKIRDLIEFELIIYLKTPGTKGGKFADEVGSMLYVSEVETLYLSGNGSSFPISILNGNKNDPLWIINYNCEDPLSDEFSSAVELLVNKNHIDYYLLDMEAPIASNKTAMYREMISSFYIELICCVIENVNRDCLINGDEYEEGSVAHALSYFVKQFDIDITSPMTLGKTIRTAIDKRL